MVLYGVLSLFISLFPLALCFFLSHGGLSVLLSIHFLILAHVCMYVCIGSDELLISNQWILDFLSCYIKQ